MTRFSHRVYLIPLLICLLSFIRFYFILSILACRCLSITCIPAMRTNGKVRGRSVAKEEVWLSLRVAAIQRRWLKRLDCERRPEHFLWNLNNFRHGTVRDTQVTPSTGSNSGCQRRRSQVGDGNLRVVALLQISLPRQWLLAPRAKAALAAAVDALRGC